MIRIPLGQPGACSPLLNSMTQEEKDLIAGAIRGQATY